MVIVPRSLRDQWTQELDERFGLSVTTGDREGLDGVVRTLPHGQNPWAGAGTWIVSADFLKQPHVIDAIPPVPWDIVIVDEAQSLERNVLLTVLSRIGANSKVVLTHDVAQRDNLRVGRHDGVVAVVERLKGHPLFAHVTLTRSERSPIAALVTEMLEHVTL